MSKIIIFFQGTIVGIVLATDGDSGKNAELKYSMPTPNMFFDIDANTGEL